MKLLQGGKKSLAVFGLGEGRGGEVIDGALPLKGGGEFPFILVVSSGNNDQQKGKERLAARREKGLRFGGKKSSSESSNNVGKKPALKAGRRSPTKGNVVHDGAGRVEAPVGKKTRKKTQSSSGGKGRARASGEGMRP